MVAARTVSWRAAATSAVFPAGGDDVRRRVQDGRDARAWSATVRSRSTAARGSCSAAPSWPPPAPTSSSRPTSGTARRTSGASAPHSRTCRWPRHRARADRCRAVGGRNTEELTQTDSRRRQTSPRTVADLRRTRLRADKGQFLHQDTPPNAFARDRCWWQVSWLAGRRSSTAFPGSLSAPSGISVASSPLTVAGAAAALSPRSLLIPCGNHHRKLAAV